MKNFCNSRWCNQQTLLNKFEQFSMSLVFLFFFLCNLSSKTPKVKFFFHFWCLQWCGPLLLPKMASTFGTPLWGTTLGFLSRFTDTKPGLCIWRFVEKLKYLYALFFNRVCQKIQKRHYLFSNLYKTAILAPKIWLPICIQGA